MIQMKWAASCIAAAGRGPGRQQEARCRKGNESERCGAGYEGSTLTLDDLWRVFSCYGEVASVIIEPGRGATVTYRDQCSFPELEPGAELELVCGEQRVLVSRHQVWPLEGAEWP